jgi:predicted dehydrogenase
MLQSIPGVELSAYWNRPEDPHLGPRFLAEFGGQYQTDDIARIAEDPNIDAVYLCTMHNDRLRLIEAFAQAGKAIFSEKPLAHTPEMLRAMHRTLQAHPTLFQSGYKIRFNSLVAEARALMPEPELLFAHVLDETWPANHLNNPAVGGGNVRAQGVYPADALHILAGSEPVSVTATVKNGRQPSGVEDTIAATFQFKNGAIGALIAADAGTATDGVSKFFVEACGGNAALALHARFTRLEYRKAGAEPRVITGEEDGFLRESVAFVHAIRTGSPSPCDFRQGAIPSIMIDSAIEAAHTGRRVDIDVDAWLAG